MTSPAYATCVAALERLLSPRVASRTLRAAMQASGVTPDAATAEQLDPILKGPVFKQLQVAMPPDAAREAVEEILSAMRDAEAPTPAPDDPGPDPSAPSPPGPGADRSATGRSAPDAETPDRAAAAVAPAEAHPELERLRAALRPFNLYFEWPEVRRLRAQLGRAHEAHETGGEVDALLTEAADTLQEVEQKLEDRLVEQAEQVASLEEAFEQVRGLGGAKVRRLESLLRRIRDAQENRQLADAEIERGSGLVRELRKMQASSVYQDRPGEEGDQLREQLAALDQAAELEAIDRLERQWTLLLQHREDLAARLEEARTQVRGGLTLGDDLGRFEETFAQARTERLREVEAELDRTAASLDEADAWSEALRREAEVLRALLDDGLPPLADLVRFHDRSALALRRAESGPAAEAPEGEGVVRSPLDRQGARLARAQEDLLRYEEYDDEALDRYRDAVEELRAAQAEERVDADAEAAVRDAAEAWGLALRASGDAETAHRTQFGALLQRLEGLPAALDPDGTASLRADLERWSAGPPDEELLAAASAAVADRVAEARAAARTRLERLADDAARLGDEELLSAVRSANERLEDGLDPDLDDLEAAAAGALERAASEQLDRLHALEREADRLREIDPREEERLDALLAEAREAIAEGRSASSLAEAAEVAERLATTLDRRIENVMPRLDEALEAFAKVERLNSDDVATVRRILRHLDGQRAAFARVSPALRARMERSLQEAEDLLGRLEEEERATRAIADQLMASDRFDGLLDLFGGGAADAAAEAHGDEAPQTGSGEAWLRKQLVGRSVSAAALAGPDGAPVAAGGTTDGSDDLWAGPAETLVRRLGDLGRELGIGRFRMITVEREDGCVLLASAPEGAALLASDDPAAVGILAAQLRSDPAWRAALAARGAGEEP